MVALLLGAPTSGRAGTATDGGEHTARAVSGPVTPAPRAAARLAVRTVARGLDHPWEVRPLPRGRLLLTQRDRRALTVVHRGRTHDVRFANGRIWVSGETGLMGLEVDPRFRHNRRIYTCSGWTADGRHDIRVVAWRLGRDHRRAFFRGTLLAGLPTSSGRHGGCRLLITRQGALVVGTGDAAVGTHPRDLTSLGGKTLRLDRFTGRPWPTNPFIRAADRRTRYVLTYGHRNVQGLAQRRDGRLWSVEQGSSRDDEVNLLVPGGDYGWHPVPGYNETVPMTDHGLPGDQQGARWRSGVTTEATSGGTFLPARGWGRLNGAMAVAALKNQRLVFLRFDRAGRLLSEQPGLTGHGRLRTATVARNGDLLVTTDNGGGVDRVLRVRLAR